jgi:phosphocarrier protein
MNHKQERIKMISRNITIKNSVGLYARPATFFIQKANTYKSSIWIQKDDRRVNAKSLLGVLSLAISGGSTVTLIADGPDETDAISGLELLVSTEI